MEDARKEVAAVLLEAAEKAGFRNAGEPLNYAPELAQWEVELFAAMLRELRFRLQQEKRDALNPDEIDSLFSFASGKGAEHAVAYFSNTASSNDLNGMLNGRTPLYVTDGIMAFLKRTPIAAELGRAFLDFRADHAEGDALLALFEALRWTFRITVHLVLEMLEEADNQNG